MKNEKLATMNQQTEATFSELLNYMPEKEREYYKMRMKSATCKAAADTLVQLQETLIKRNPFLGESEKRVRLAFLERVRKEITATTMISEAEGAQ